MDNRYSNDNLEEHVENLIGLLTAIAMKENKGLNVRHTLVSNDKMTIDKATCLGMQENARLSIVQALALAEGFDRVLRMLDTMVSDMTKLDAKKGNEYKVRIEALLHLDKIVDELTHSQQSRKKKKLPEGEK